MNVNKYYVTVVRQLEYNIYKETLKNCTESTVRDAQSDVIDAN